MECFTGYTCAWIAKPAHGSLHCQKLVAAPRLQEKLTSRCHHRSSQPWCGLPAHGVFYWWRGLLNLPIDRYIAKHWWRRRVCKTVPAAAAATTVPAFPPASHSAGYLHMECFTIVLPGHGLLYLLMDCYITKQRKTTPGISQMQCGSDVAICF